MGSLKLGSVKKYSAATQGPQGPGAMMAQPLYTIQKLFK